MNSPAAELNNKAEAPAAQPQRVDQFDSTQNLASVRFRERPGKPVPDSDWAGFDGIVHSLRGKSLTKVDLGREAGHPEDSLMVIDVRGASLDKVRATGKVSLLVDETTKGEPELREGARTVRIRDLAGSFAKHRELDTLVSRSQATIEAWIALVGNPKPDSGQIGLEGDASRARFRDALKVFSKTLGDVEQSVSATLPSVPRGELVESVCSQLRGLSKDARNEREQSGAYPEWEQLGAFARELERAIYAASDERQRLEHQPNSDLLPVIGPNTYTGQSRISPKEFLSDIALSDHQVANAFSSQIRLGKRSDEELSHAIKLVADKIEETVQRIERDGARDPDSYHKYEREYSKFIGGVHRAIEYGLVEGKGASFVAGVSKALGTRVRELARPITDAFERPSVEAEHRKELAGALAAVDGRKATEVFIRTIRRYYELPKATVDAALHGLNELPSSGGAFRALSQLFGKEMVCADGKAASIDLIAKAAGKADTVEARSFIRNYFREHVIKAEDPGMRRMEIALAAMANIGGKLERELLRAFRGTGLAEHALAPVNQAIDSTIARETNPFTRFSQSTYERLARIF